jgi:hypothetical protein
VLAGPAATSTNAGAGIAGVLVFIVIVLVAFAAYWVPTIIAYSRRVPNLGSAVVINFLLGWTLVGWAVALAMAARSTTSPVTLVGAPGWQLPPPGYPPTTPQPQGTRRYSRRVSTSRLNCSSRNRTLRRSRTSSRSGSSGLRGTSNADVSTRVSIPAPNPDRSCFWGGSTVRLPALAPRPGSLAGRGQAS